MKKKLNKKKKKDNQNSNRIKWTMKLNSTFIKGFSIFYHNNWVTFFKYIKNIITPNYRNNW